jgi:hypothetical protein
LQHLDELSTVGLLCAQAIPTLCKISAHPVIPNLHVITLAANLVSLPSIRCIGLMNPIFASV